MNKWYLSTQDQEGCGGTRLKSYNGQADKNFPKYPACAPKIVNVRMTTPPKISSWKKQMVNIG